MSLSSILFLPEMIMVAGVALARMGLSLTRHVPSIAAIAFFDWPAKRTVTTSPGSALPQIGTA